MNKSVTAPCQACGGLLPLIPIQKRRPNKQHQSRSLQPSQEEPRQSKDVSRSKDSHYLQTELGLPSHSENSAVLEKSILSSTNFDSEREESSDKRRSYDSLLEEIQAIFAGQKVKKVTISSYMHRYQRQLERKQQERIQTHERVSNQHALVSKSRSQANRIVHQQPPEDIASNCSFDPLRISHSPRVHESYEEKPPQLLPEFRPTQSSTHQIGEHSKREKIGRGATTCFLPPCSVSTKQKNHESRHGAVDDHQEACRPSVESAERDTQPRVDNDCYHDVMPFYEECNLHQINEHITTALITSPRGSRKSQQHSYKESGFRNQPQPQPQPQKIVYSCDQLVCQQSVVWHREGCYLHQRDDLEFPRALSPRREDSSKCQRCGCTQQDYPVRQEESFQGPADCKYTCHDSSEAYAKTIRGFEQEVTACAQRFSSCTLHGDCSQQKLDVCGVLHHKDLQRKSAEDRNCPICKHPCKDHHTSPRKEKILRCHLHVDTPRPAPNPKCAQEPKDPLVWTPRRVWKPKPSSVHWLDRITASQKIPPHIVRQYLQGKRRCPPRWKKLECTACTRKITDGNASSRDPCQRVVSEPWNAGSDMAAGSTVECKEWKEHRGKLSRLAISRTLIVKPVPKVYTSPRLWTRKEFEVCSECRDLKLFRSVGIRSGRWSSILETMSSTGLHEGAEMSSNCSTKFSCHSVHGLSRPNNTRAMDLRGPELNSAFRLHTKLQKLQNETFDRRAAVQIAKMEGIELNKEVFDLLPETKTSQRGGLRKSHNVRRRIKRWEIYRGLSKIVELPIPSCQQCPPRDVGVQVCKEDAAPVGNLWNMSDFCPEVQSNLQPTSPNLTSCINWPEQDHSNRQGQGQYNCQAQDQSLDEQHWAYLVESSRKMRMAQGDFGSCRACQ